MSAGSNEQLTELVQHIAAEQNPTKLKELVKQLNHLLDERKKSTEPDPNPA